MLMTNMRMTVLCTAQVCPVKHNAVLRHVLGMVNAALASCMTGSGTLAALAAAQHLQSIRPA